MLLSRVIRPFAFICLRVDLPAAAELADPTPGLEGLRRDAGEALVEDAQHGVSLVE